MNHRVRLAVRSVICVAAFASILAISVRAQQQNYPPPVNFTADQDHQNMMDQLGIKKLREGPSGDEKAPNHANYDESLANP
ncbi:MAG: acetylxylan esterase, partial [Candidatus Acidiferrales bacterium]